MKEKLLRFMTGRNGNDELNRFLLMAVAVLLLLGAIFRKTLGSFFMSLALALLALMYFRMFSKDRVRRSEENGKFMILRDRFLRSLHMWKERWAQRRDYKFFTCPACKTVLRVPKGRGRIKIVCRKCGNSFTGKS